MLFGLLRWSYVDICFLLNIFSLCTVNAFFYPSNITCYCNNKSWVGNKHRECINNRCSSQHALTDCYVMKIDENTVEKGCTFRPICMAYAHKENEFKKKIIHCCRSPLCNEHINGSDLFFINDETAATVPPKKESSRLSKELIVVIIVIPVSLLVITIFAMWKQLRKSNDSFTSTLLQPRENEHYRSDITTFSSGTGTGVPLLVQQTISFQIVLQECVSKGKFGIVYRGKWHGDDVAVKIFSTGEETSWFCEREIYQTTMLRHENILGFIAADSKDTGVSTEYWLVCEYHENGSLFNYLQTQALHLQTMLKMIFGIVCGLNHLHMQITGSQGKPPIAHRDMKTKNILVKSDNTCCIADLGLAITRATVNSGVINSWRTGTRRYHSPELLNDSMDTSHFDSYLKADIYALGLCIWEVCWRTRLSGVTQEYQLPYFDKVPPNPSEEDMRKAVCLENIRPTFPDHWHQFHEMKVVMKIMDECWCHDASARLPTLRIKKNIYALKRTTYTI